MHDNELAKLKSGFDEDMWNLLAEQGCYIAGGAITSVFTNKEINDFDVYFPSKEAFTKVFSEVYKDSWDDWKSSEFGLNFSSGVVAVVTKKALLLFRGESKIQFIVHDFYDSAEAIFDDFDFTVCMGALNMKDESWSFHPDFFKHNSQRYLHFNPSTSFPLISAMRVDKYKKLKGYEISKSQMFKILCAINAKKIDNWQTLMEEMGGLYGAAPEEIFSTAETFSLELAMQDLDRATIKETVKPNTANLSKKEIATIVKHAFTDEYLEKHGIPKEEFKTIEEWLKDIVVKKPDYPTSGGFELDDEGYPIPC